MSLELDLETAGVAEVTAAMASGATTSVGLVEAYLDRIATLDPLVNAIRCLAPDALGPSGGARRRARPRVGCGGRCTAYPCW